MPFPRSAFAIVTGAVLGAVVVGCARTQAQAGDPMRGRAGRSLARTPPPRPRATSDPLALKLVTYYRLLAPDAASAAEIAVLHRRQPGVAEPGRAREAARRGAGPRAGRAGRARAMPARSRAAGRGQAALRRAPSPPPGDADKRPRRIRAAWRDGITDPASESAFLLRFGAIVRPEDQWARFYRLAWSSDAGPPPVRRAASTPHGARRPRRCSR